MNSDTTLKEVSLVELHRKLLEIDKLVKLRDRISCTNEGGPCNLVRSLAQLIREKRVELFNSIITTDESLASTTSLYHDPYDEIPF